MIKTSDRAKIEAAEQRVIKHLNELTHSHNERIEQFPVDIILNALVAYEMAIQDLREEYSFSGRDFPIAPVPPKRNGLPV